MKDLLKRQLTAVPLLVFERLQAKMKKVEAVLEQEEKVRVLKKILKESLPAERYILQLYIRRLLQGPKVHIGKVNVESTTEVVDLLSFFYALDHADHPNMKLELPRFVYKTDGVIQWFLRSAATKLNIFGIRREELEAIYDAKCVPMDSQPETRGRRHKSETVWPKLLVKINDEAEEKYFLKMDGQIISTFSPSNTKIFEVAGEYSEQFCVLGYETPRQIVVVVCSDTMTACELVIKRSRIKEDLPMQVKSLTKGMARVQQARIKLKDFQKVPEIIKTAEFRHVHNLREMLTKMITGKFLEVNRRMVKKVDYDIERKESYIANYELGAERFFITSDGDKILFKNYLSAVDVKTIGSKIGEPIWVMKFAGETYGKRRV